MDVQQTLLATIGRLSGIGKRPIEASDLAAAVKLSAATAGLCNTFFADAGWLVRTGRGQYAASDALLEHVRQLSLDPADVDGATKPLRETITVQSWHWPVLAQLLQLGPMSRKEVLATLMREAGTSGHDEHVQQITNLLHWLVYVRLLVIEGDRIEMRRSAEITAETQARPPADQPAQESADDQPAPAPTPDKVELPVVLALDVTLKMTARDLAELDPAQITALYQAVGTLAALNSKRS